MIRDNLLVDRLIQHEGKAELVHGEIVPMAPTGGLPSYAAGEIYSSLREYARHDPAGHAIPDNAGFLVNLPNRKSFSPDAAYFIGELSMGFLEGAPIFAAEVRSQNDYGPEVEKKLAAKRADYFAAGTQVVWDVDLVNEVVRSYSAEQSETPTEFRRGQSAHAETAVPGWSMRVDELWP